MKNKKADKIVQTNQQQKYMNYSIFTKNTDDINYNDKKVFFKYNNLYLQNLEHKTNQRNSYKDRKSVNNSMIDISMNTSNFNIHNNKYSHLSNISTDIINLYNDFNFNRAPSICQNFSRIRNMIKKRKYNLAKNLDKFIC